MTESAAKQIRRVILDQSKRAHVGHIGSALSVADIIAALYGGVLRVREPKDPERDRFVLAKGHAMLAVHAALFLKGWLTQEELNTYCSDGSMLGVHPEYGLRGVDFASGLLGQGLPMAAGAALAARLQHSPRWAGALAQSQCHCRLSPPAR
jgi:transketolase